MPLHKKTISGNIDETLSHVSEYDSFGAQILDVIFYDGSGGEVTPTDGQYLVQWSANGKYWNDFEGVQIPVNVGTPVEDWQASGFILHIRAVPIAITGAVTWSLSFRTHGIGMPSGVARSFSANRYFSASNVVQVSGFQHSVLQGNAIATSNKVTIPANSVVSIKPVSNANTVFTDVACNGVFISFYDGVVSGELIDLSSGVRLNTLEDFRFQSSYEFYDGACTGEAAYTSINHLDVPFIINGGGAIQLENTTDSDIETFFSCGQVALSAPTIPFMLTAETQLEANTEMSTYNG